MMNFKSEIYRTKKGVQVCADSIEILPLVPEESVDLIFMSPPFALLHKKEFENKNEDEYVGWIRNFGKEAIRVLKPTGSFVMELGGEYRQGRPVRSLYNFRVLLDFCDNLGYNLAQEFFLYNPAAIPSPVEWVDVRKIRAKGAVNTVWWFSRTDCPKANVTKVLVPYSERMRKLLCNPDTYSQPRNLPPGHPTGPCFCKGTGGSIPPNLLQIYNADSNSHYFRACIALGELSHPAGFPQEFPDFFIRFLTDPDDVVLDIFSGSNTTGYVAEKLDRKWLSVEMNRKYATLSAIRFMEGWDIDQIKYVLSLIERGICPALSDFAPDIGEKTPKLTDFVEEKNDE